MRLLPILTNSFFLSVVQQLISLWFLFDFFLARDSLTVNSIWKPAPNKDYLFEQVQLAANQVELKHCSNQNLEEPLFDKIIFIVIDALGSDFVPSIKNNGKPDKVAMPFLEKSIVNRKAMGYIARAATPTVTMPRIKALLSGTIPSFVDILYNLASDVSNFEDDNILRIAKARNKTLVFYGDDTWLSLFDRTMFIRSKETLSFYANDYTTVDTNVTNLALPETNIQHIDWDYMILHYLGLDHIGHVYGSNRTPLIREKLVEMDTVIKQIYENMAKREYRTLVVVCGDHGMSREGNHGGDSDLEAQTAMVFLPINRNLKKLNLHQTSIKQIDMAATLSILTGEPIPKMSRGVAIETLLYSLFASDSQKLSCAAFENLMELVNLTNPLEAETKNIYLDIINLMGTSVKSEVNFKKSVQDFFKLSRDIQDKLLETMATNNNPVLLVIALASVTLLSLINIRRTSIRLLLPALTKSERFMCISTLIIPILMHGSTDFIELEHVFWPLYSIITATLFIGIAIKSQPSIMRSLDTLKVIFFFIFFVLSTFWNNWKLSEDGSYRSHPIIYMFAIAILCNFIRQNSDIKKFKAQFAIILGAIVIISNHTDEPSDLDALTSVDHRVSIQRISLLVLVIHTIANIIYGGKEQSVSSLISKLASGWISLAFLLARSHNFLFYAANIIMETSLNNIANSLKFSTITRTLLYISFAQASYYNQGNSNLFSSLDIRPAFFAQDTYQLSISIPLVAAATFSAQIYWYLKMFQRNQNVGSIFNGGDILTPKLEPEIPIKAVSDFVTVRNFLSLSYFMFVCIVLRNHLFVWSVLSPKLIYHTVSNNILLLTTLMISNLQFFVRETQNSVKKVKEIRE